MFNPNGADDCNASHETSDKLSRGSNLYARLLTASGAEIKPL
jgi:hypothetical protein